MIHSPFLSKSMEKYAILQEKTVFVQKYGKMDYNRSILSYMVSFLFDISTFFVPALKFVQVFIRFFIIIRYLIAAC